MHHYTDLQQQKLFILFIIYMEYLSIKNNLIPNQEAPHCTSVDCAGLLLCVLSAQLPLYHVLLKKKVTSYHV
jgi:hypothetical protein